MNSITINDLLINLSEYNPDAISDVKKAYDYASYLHNGQVRQSGDPYISHPLNVAYILSEMHADSDTVCAGLLHDTLEDTNIKKEDIAHDFNQNVANLVDGVTKLAKMNFSSKQDQNYANTRKIITGITDDVRIIIIKLADRLHNMRTLEFKSEFKQKENSLETMEIFVPLAYYIGAYRIKSELEDLSLKYLKPDVYKRIGEKKIKLEEASGDILKEMLYNIETLLNDRNIPNEIKVRTKNIYGIYKRLSEGHKLSDIHDLLALKIMVDEIENCYIGLYLVHSKYKPINDKFKDYICNPKTNMYRSLHTTVFGPEDRLVQTQIRTFDMDKIASFGLTAYWDIEKGKARDVMQDDLKQKYQFFKSLIEINSIFGDNQQFVNQVKNELFANKIYVYTTKGDIIELPIGSTIIDYAYKLDTNIGNTMIGAFVNDEYVPLDYVLQNKDRVRIVTNELSYGPREEWLDIAKTSLAKSKIKEFNRKLFIENGDKA
ncbi:MAG: RelA/SpoT family protein [Tenericutes bacterium]|nr:RelA/SpoT family protein [Mycoplasmatota bacterium]